MVVSEWQISAEAQNHLLWLVRGRLSKWRYRCYVTAAMKRLATTLPAPENALLSAANKVRLIVMKAGLNKEAAHQYLRRNENIKRNN